MRSGLEGLILRQIQEGDNTRKLSLGKTSFLPLKVFLQKDALDFHQFEIAKTYVLIDSEGSSNHVLGYITLTSSQVVLDPLELRPRETESTAKYDTYPAIKIVRLAVDQRLQGQGVGTYLLDWCIGLVKLSIMPHIGCRFLVVDAKQESIQFYQKSGFQLINTEACRLDEHPPMFFDLMKS